MKKSLLSIAALTFVFASSAAMAQTDGPASAPTHAAKHVKHAKPAAKSSKHHKHHKAAK